MTPRSLKEKAGIAVPGATKSYSTVKVKVSRTGGGGLRFQRQNEWLTTVPNQASDNGRNTMKLDALNTRLSFINSSQVTEKYQGTFLRWPLGYLSLIDLKPQRSSKELL